MRRSIAVLLLGVSLAACGSVSPGTKEGQFEGAPTFLRREIKGRIAALPYQSGARLYQNIMRLLYIGDPAIPYLLDALKDKHAETRSSCAYILGLLKDRRTIDPLRPLLKDPDPSVRYEAATALCGMGVIQGYPVLIDGLSDPNIRNRYKAHQALQQLTKLNFGYVHDAAPAQREKAIAKWKRWWKKMSTSTD